MEPAPTARPELHGPRYDIDSQHHFSEIISHAQKLKDLHGPVYDPEGETTHHFHEMTKHVESLLLMAKPVFVEEGKHSYGEETGKEQGARTVQGLNTYDCGILCQLLRSTSQIDHSK